MTQAFVVDLGLTVALFSSLCLGCAAVRAGEEPAAPAEGSYITAWTLRANFSPNEEDLRKWQAFLPTWKPYGSTLERLHLKTDLPGVWSDGPWEFRDGSAVLTEFPGYPIPWIAPYRYSGLKDFQVTARVKLLDDKINSWGIELGATWLPRPHSWTVWYLNTGRLYLRKTYDAVPEAVMLDGMPKQVKGMVVDIGMRYSLSERVVCVDLNGQTVITHAMPGDTAEEFEKINGYASNALGVGVYSNGPRLEVQSIEVTAGAPWSRVVAIGDSITHHLFWPEALSERLGEPVTNLGIGGDTADMMKTRIAHDVVAIKPHICFVLIGSNDLARPIGPVVADIRESVTELKRAGIRPVVGAILPRKRIAPDYIRRYNIALKQMAEEEQVAFVDWFDAMLHPDADGLAAEWSNHGDGTHPSSLGAKRMADQVDPALFAR